jgi:hypothetical protein
MLIVFMSKKPALDNDVEIEAKKNKGKSRQYPNVNEDDKLSFFFEKLIDLQRQRFDQLEDKIIKLENKIITDSYYVRPENKKKYDIILKIVNEVLKENNKPEIEHLLDFKNVERECLIGENIDKIVDNHITEILEAGFSKPQLGWNNKSKLKCFIFTFLKNSCQNIDLCFSSKQKVIPIITDGVEKTKWSTIYDIVKKT